MAAEVGAGGFPLAFGLNTFGDVEVDREGIAISYAQVIRNVVEQAVLADRAASTSSGSASITATTSRSPRLRSCWARSPAGPNGSPRHCGDRPQFGRPRACVREVRHPGRTLQRPGGADPRPWLVHRVIPLFGFHLQDYEVLFEEKLDLFSHLLDEAPVTWEGTIRPPLNHQEAFPKDGIGKLKAWVGVGGSPESVVRAARYGLPLVLAIIGGQPARFAPYVDLYHRALAQLGQPLPVAVHSPGFIAETDEEAADILWPRHREMIGSGIERGTCRRTSRDRFESEIHEGALHVGSPETVAQKIADHDRTRRQPVRPQVPQGDGSHDELMTDIELYGTEVIPRVRELLAN